LAVTAAGAAVAGLLGPAVGAPSPATTAALRTAAATPLQQRLDTLLTDSRFHGSQVGLVVRDQVLTTHAAREAARAVAVDDRPGAAEAAAADGTGLPAGRLSVRVGPRGEAGSRVRVEVRYRAPTDVPLVGRFVGDVTLTASATMRVEQ